MHLQEALLIIGLDEGINQIKTEHDIDFAVVRKAHLRVLEMNRGESDYLVKKIHEAKDHIIFALT